MHFSSFTALPVLLGVLHLVTFTSAEGINCEGSSNCFDGIDSPLLSDMVNILVNNIDPNRFYNNGEQIICEDEVGVCAFCQNSGGAPGSSISTLIQELLQHGCTVCGSIPLFFPSDNNVADGELTVNAVSSTCGGSLFETDGFDFVMCS